MLKKWVKGLGGIAIVGFMVSFLMVHTAYGVTADEWVAQGDAALASHNTVLAYQDYLNAYNLSPTHPGANFGLALLNLPHQLIDGGDSAVTAFLTSNHITHTGNIYDLVFNTGEFTATIPETQDFISAHVLPYIDQAISYLQKVEANPSFTKTITAAMYAGDSNKEWDNADTLAAEGAMQLLKGFLNTACAYNLDFDPEYGNFPQILSHYPNLFTIKTGGQAKLNTALVAFQSSLDRLTGSYDSIGAETDPQENDILTFSDEDFTFNYVKSDVRSLLGDLRLALNPGGKSIDPRNLILKLGYYDQGAPSNFPKTIDFSRFFTNPITRTNLALLTYDADGNVVFSSVWGLDQTLNGVLPGMLKPEFVGYLREGSYSPKIEIINENSIAISGGAGAAPISDISNIKIYRSTTPVVTTGSTLIATLSPAEFAGFRIIDNAAPGATYYYREIVTYKDTSVPPTSSIRAARKLYVNKDFSGIYKGTGSEPYKYIGKATDYGNAGSTIFVGQGIYNLSDDPEWWGSLDLRYGMKIFGSCNPSTWTSNLDLYPTTIDADGNVNVFECREGNNTIKNFVLRNSGYGAIDAWRGEGDNINIENCLISHCGLWEGGFALTINNNANFTVSNCTIADNGRGIYVYGQGTIKNSIIVNNGAVGIERWGGGSLTFSHNDVWNNGVNYNGIDDPTGTNGNLKVNPLFVSADNYRLQFGSPCLGAGEGGTDIGAYPSGHAVLPGGDINGDSTINITDVILCLRQAIGLDTPNPTLADMNGDGLVNITDVILILRKAIGLDARMEVW